MTPETQKSQHNLIFNRTIDGMFSEALQHPDKVRLDSSTQSEVVIVRNNKVRAELHRPTLDGANSEAWEAPWDADVKLRAKIKLTSVNGKEFAFKDLAGNTYLLPSMYLAVSDDGSVKPFFVNDAEHMVGEPLGEDYLLGLLMAEHFEFENTRANQ